MCKAEFIPATMEAIGSSQRQDIRSVLQEGSFWLLQWVPEGAPVGRDSQVRGAGSPSAHLSALEMKSRARS